MQWFKVIGFSGELDLVAELDCGSPFVSYRGRLYDSADVLAEGIERFLNHEVPNDK